VQSHTLAYDFEDVDDAERPVALVRAQLAMIEGPLYGLDRWGHTVCKTA
jgi:hypothetical protein